MDRIIVPDLSVQARVGVPEGERTKTQDLVLSVELFLDLGRAGVADDLAATVDYEEVCRLLTAVAASRSFHLIEAVAETAAATLLAALSVDEVKVLVRKPGALRTWGVPYAAAEVHRRRGD